MAKRERHNLREYESVKQALQVRADACAFAAQVGAGQDMGAEEIFALCVMFESYIAHGSSWTRKHMINKMDGEPKPKGAPLIQLIRRDD